MPNKPTSNTKFSINFYDPVDFEGANKQYSPDEISRAVALANKNFSCIRTISDFNSGDPGQYVGSAYQPIPGLPVNPRNSAWQEAVRSTLLDVILTIEHPKKWLSSIELAVSYVYQYILPLMQNFIAPTKTKYPPQYYGNTPINSEVIFTNVKDHVIAIVVGLEVGTHLQTTMSDTQFVSKADIVTNLPIYIDNLLAALEIFGLQNKIKVTSSFAPSNANASAEELASKGIFEFIVQKDGVYSFNTNSYEINGVTINFGNVLKAIDTMHKHDFPYSVGFMLSVYSYWQYQPEVDFPAKTANDWALSTSARYSAIKEPFLDKNCAIGEIGWPTDGSNSIDGSPNKPDKNICNNLLHGLLLWSKSASNFTTPPPSFTCLWQLTDAEKDSAIELEDPERNYGFYNNGLRDTDNSLKFPQMSGMFKGEEQKSTSCIVKHKL